MSRKFKLILSGALAILAALSTYAYGESIRDKCEADRAQTISKYGGEMTQIVVATEELQAGDVLSANNCALKDWVSDLVPTDSITEIDSALNESIGCPLTKGSPITKASLKKATDSIEIPKGDVAIAVSISDKTGITSAIPNGSNLQAYLVKDGKCRLICGDVTVLSSGTSSAKGGQITIGVKKEFTTQIMSANSDGSLRLIQAGSSEEEPLPTANTSIDKTDNSDGTDAKGDKNE